VSVDPLLRRQAGIVTLQQAVALGMARQTVQRKVQDGAWERLHPGVYLVGGHLLTDDPERFRNDRREQNALVRDGWDLLRFTWHDLDGRPSAVVGEVSATLAAAA